MHDGGLHDFAVPASRRWLDARERGDLEQLAALTAADATWESPVEGTVRGRAAVVEQVRAGFAETDAFATRLLAYESRGDRAAAIVRNTRRREQEVLDSRQALLFHERDGLVARVRIVVDDPDAVAAFWAGE
jgi:ketosteroid isomerase-like protein